MLQQPTDVILGKTIRDHDARERMLGDYSRINARPSLQVIDEILGRLTNDNDFREQVLGDPISAFKPYGITIDPNDVPFTRTLPSRAILAEVCAKHADTVRKQCAMIIFIAK